MSAAIDSQTTDSIEFIPLEHYSFTGDNPTLQRKRAFVEAFREEGTIYHAAIVAGIHRSTYYDWIEQDPAFLQAVEDSKEDCYDKAETSVFRKALAGDSLLLMFYLKAHRPKFRDKVTIDIEALNHEIRERMRGLDLRQLPAATTQFIDVSASQSETSQTTEHMQFSPPCDDLQKEGGK